MLEVTADRRSAPKRRPPSPPQRCQATRFQPHYLVVSARSAYHMWRVNMANIRRKLKENPSEPKYILTELGIGYRMLEDSN